MDSAVADVGPWLVMRNRLTSAVILIIAAVAFSGCNQGVISDKDQMAKAKALEDFAKAKAPDDVEKVRR